MSLELSSFKKAVAALEELVLRVKNKDFTKLDEVMRKGLQAGVVQNFEITYELSWKFMKRYLEEQLGSSYVDGVSRADLFRLAAEQHLIDDIKKWRKYHEYRNLTTHTYDEEIADEVFKVAVTFVAEVKKLLTALEARND